MKKVILATALSIVSSAAYPEDIQPSLRTMARFTTVYEAIWDSGSPNQIYNNAVRYVAARGGSTNTVCNQEICTDHAITPNSDLNGVFLQVSKSRNLQNGRTARELCIITPPSLRHCRDIDTKVVSDWKIAEQNGVRGWIKTPPITATSPASQAQLSPMQAIKRQNDRTGQISSSGHPYKEGVWQSDRLGAIGPNQCDLSRPFKVVKNDGIEVIYLSKFDRDVGDGNVEIYNYIAENTYEHGIKALNYTETVTKSRDGNIITVSNISVDYTKIYEHWHATTNATDDNIQYYIQNLNKIIGANYFYCGPYN